jgi:flagellar hook-associated protein 2
MNSLAEIGITSQKDGTLAVDGSKLDKALAANGPTVKSLFGGTGGLAKKLTGLVDNLVGDAGTLTARNESLSKKTADLANQRSALEARLATVETRYRAQFTALETMMAKMQSTSSYLSQQLARL